MTGSNAESVARNRRFEVGTGSKFGEFERRREISSPPLGAPSSAIQDPFRIWEIAQYLIFSPFIEIFRPLVEGTCGARNSPLRKLEAQDGEQSATSLEQVASLEQPLFFDHGNVDQLAEHVDESRIVDARKTPWIEARAGPGASCELFQDFDDFEAQALQSRPVPCRFEDLLQTFHRRDTIESLAARRLVDDPEAVSSQQDKVVATVRSSRDAFYHAGTPDRKHRGVP